MLVSNYERQKEPTFKLHSGKFFPKVSTNKIEEQRKHITIQTTLPLSVAIMQ